MKRDFDTLRDRDFDLLIIGGGITGAALAWDASLRGLKVALVDKGDFGCATSSATSKLIHGGLRYLKNGDFRLVRESLRERSILLSIAPHLVRPLKFLVPTYRTGGVGKWTLRAGLTLYDLLSMGRVEGMDARFHFPRHRMLGIEDTLASAPGLQMRDLTASALYYDCFCEPDRLTLAFLLGASRQRAVVVNYSAVTDLLFRENQVVGAEVMDGFSGQSCQVRARMTVNAAGPWADAIDALALRARSLKLRRSKGIHIVTRAIGGDCALVLMTKAGRHFFVIPWRGCSLVGTTDTQYEGNPDDLRVEPEEVREFLSHINEVLPAAALSEQDVLYRYAGLRPLVDQDSQVYQASRRYEIVDHHANDQSKGFISVVGGKYTTSRSLAGKLTGVIMKHLGRSDPGCVTARKKLPGAPDGAMQPYVDACVRQMRQPADREIIENLVYTYGADYSRVFELGEQNPVLAARVRPDRPEIFAQVVYAIEHEMACTLSDIMFRRTGLGTQGHLGNQALERILEIAAGWLGWDLQRKEKERDAYWNKLMGRPEGITPPSSAISVS